jgi:hypothetical protein
MCDAFLVLAQAPGGLVVLFAAALAPDGSKNPMQVLRLKKKMGNVSNASSETELRGALAWMVGEEGRGVRTIIEMVSMTRFDCMIGSSAGMRMACLAGLAPLLGALRLWQGAEPAAADAKRAGRPGAGERSRHGADHAHGPRHGPPHKSMRTCWCAWHGGGQVLDLQAHAQPRLRGHGMHWRQRRDGRQHVAAPVPRVAHQRHLGRQRQCAVPGRAARHVQRPPPWWNAFFAEVGKARGGHAELDTLCGSAGERISRT